MGRLKRVLTLSVVVYALVGLMASLTDPAFVQLPPVDHRIGKAWEPLPVPMPKLPRLHRVTAYCACPICCGQWADGITADGSLVQEGWTVAADPLVWPLGTCLEVHGLGKRLVQDTGSAIQGLSIDVFMRDHERALEWGVRWMMAGQCEA